jgi:hypothetical protein
LKVENGDERISIFPLEMQGNIGATSTRKIKI